MQLGQILCFQSFYFFTLFVKGNAVGAANFLPYTVFFFNFLTLLCRFSELLYLKDK